MIHSITLMKQNVLDLAFCGKLTEQMKKEDTGEKLFDQINKEQLKKNKKFKRMSASTKLNEVGIPFEIPEYWKWIQLGDAGVWGAGSTPARGNANFWKNGTIPWLKTGELNNSYVAESNEFITKTALEKTSVKLNKPGDILIAMYGATIGKLGILEIEATTNQACCACSPFKGVNNLYLFYYLMKSKKAFINKSEGGAQPNISKTKIIEFPFPLPPIEEQALIVEKIEALFTLINKINTKKEESIRTIQYIRETAYQNAIMGLLVKQYKNPESTYKSIKEVETKTKLNESDKKTTPFAIPLTWKFVTMNDITSKIHYGYTAPSSSIGDAKMLRITDIQKNQVNWESVPYCKIEDTKIKNYELNYGDILIARTGGTLGKSFVVTHTQNLSVFASYLIRLIPLEDVNPFFIQAFLNSNYYWQQLKTMSAGTGQPNVNAQNLKKLILPLPPIEEQNRIIIKLNEIISICDQIEKTLNGN